MIVRFVNRKKAISCLKNRRKLKNSNNYKELYISENLCPAYKSIYDKCYKMKKDGIIKKMWTFNGIVNIKYSDSERERPLKLFHIDNLD